jgi:hypothetical protein
MSTPEGSYILKSIDAARKILEIAIQASSEAQIRYMPFRFYVYVLLEPNPTTFALGNFDSDILSTPPSFYTKQTSSVPS